MLINRHIGFDATDGQGIDGALFQSELMQLDGMGKKRICIWISSPGGVVLDGYNIYAAILRTKTKVDTYNVGLSASIAAVIFQAGRTRYMADYALLMYHEAFGGDPKDLAPMNDSICTMIASRTGKPEPTIKGIMKRTTWIDATEAYDNGFCDEVENSVDFNKKRIAIGEPKMMFEQSKLILNSILQQKVQIKPTYMSIKLVTNALGLNEAATEDAILAGITTIKNKAAQDVSDITAIKNTAVKEKDDAMDKMQGLERELKDKKDAYDKVFDALNKMKSEKDEADKKAKEEADKKEEEDCKNMVTNFAKAGRIKNDAETITKWVGTAKKVGLEDAKALIEALPLNKTAPAITDVEPNKLKEGEMPTTAMGMMAKVQASVKNRKQ